MKWRGRKPLDGMAELDKQTEQYMETLIQKHGGDDPDAYREQVKLASITSLSEFAHMCDVIADGVDHATSKRDLAESAESAQHFLRLAALLLEHPERLRELLDAEEQV